MIRKLILFVGLSVGGYFAYRYFKKNGMPILNNSAKKYKKLDNEIDIMKLKEVKPTDSNSNTGNFGGFGGFQTNSDSNDNSENETSKDKDVIKMQLNIDG